MLHRLCGRNGRDDAYWPLYPGPIKLRQFRLLLKQLFNLVDHLQQEVFLRPLPPGAVGDRHHRLADQVDLVDLAQFLDNDFVSQFHVGGTQEYIGWVHGPLAPPTIVASACLQESGGQPTAFVWVR